MEWEGRQESSNVEDRRGFGGKKGIAIGGGAVGLIIAVIAMFLGINPNDVGVNNQNDRDEQALTDKANRTPEEDRMAKFTGVILKETEVVWGEQFEKMGKRYEEPKLELYSGQTQTACGEGGAAIGPFYCPADSKVYIDLGFFTVMDKQLGIKGEFPRAYVIAHEVGHHVQHLLGYSNKSRNNEGSVPLELQADYLAGVWAHDSRKNLKLTDEDITYAIEAAKKIGDDYLSKRAGKRVVPENFTHGKSEQRMRWFKKGYETGDVKGAAQLFSLPYNQL